MKLWNLRLIGYIYRINSNQADKTIGEQVVIVTKFKINTFNFRNTTSA